MICIILASGFGTRLYPITINKPKCLLEYSGKPVINYIVEKIPKQMHIFVTTNSKFKPHYQRWEQTLDRKIDVCVEPVFNEEQSLGAVGSLNYCINTKHVTNDILVLAGDNYFEFDLNTFINKFNKEKTLVAVYDIIDKDKARQFGVVQLDGHKIVRLEEKPTEPSSTLVSTACYILPKRVIHLLSEFVKGSENNNLGDFINYLINKDEVHAYSFSELWFDIGDIFSNK